MASRKPRVVISAVRAPLRSISALVNRVVPCTTCATPEAGRSAARKTLADAVFDRLVRALGRGQDLGDAHQRAGLVDRHEIGEGAADVRADPMTHVLAPHCCSPNSG